MLSIADLFKQISCTLEYGAVSLVAAIASPHILWLLSKIETRKTS